MEDNLEKLEAGDRHYKAYVGPPLKYDLLGALQFTLLTAAGLRSHHRLCDIGCGSLRGGKLLIPYLNPGCYYGLEPHQWLIEEGQQKELGADIMALKEPRFSHSENFELSTFAVKFDYLIAQSIFSHAAPPQIDRCLREARACMEEESLFLATFVEGAEDYQGGEWVYPGCVNYRPQRIAQFAESAGLRALPTDWPHPNGQSWYILCRPEGRAKAEKLRHFSLDLYRYTPPPAPPEPSLGEKLRYHWKRLFQKS